MRCGVPIYRWRNTGWKRLCNWPHITQRTVPQQSCDYRSLWLEHLALHPRTDSKGGLSLCLFYPSSLALLHLRGYKLLQKWPRCFSWSLQESKRRELGLDEDVRTTHITLWNSAPSLPSSWVVTSSHFHQRPLWPCWVGFSAFYPGWASTFRTFPCRDNT